MRRVLKQQKEAVYCVRRKGDARYASGWAGGRSNLVATKGFIKKLIAIGVAAGKISDEELAAELQAEQAKETEDEEDYPEKDGD